MSPKILIVEDDTDALKAVSIQLEAAGYVVIQATNVASAISMARSEHPDVIVLDLGLPDGNGYSVLRELNSYSVTSAPVIVLTARGSPRDQEHALDLGAVDFFQKPIPHQWLVQSIQKALAERPQKHSPLL